MKNRAVKPRLRSGLIDPSLIKTTYMPLGIDRGPAFIFGNYLGPAFSKITPLPQYLKISAPGPDISKLWPSAPASNCPPVDP